MRKPISFSIGVLVAAFALPVLGQSSPNVPFSYRVVVPADEACAAQANSIAATFAADTSLTGVTGTCEGTNALTNEGQTYQQNIVVVNYQAETPVTPVQTILGGVDDYGGPTIANGEFPSYGACLSARAAQLQLYTQNTGLTAIDSHCESGNNLVPDSWSLVIDGFGAAKASLYGLIPLQDTIPDGDASMGDVLQVASQKVTKYGGHIVFTTNDTIFYYSSVGQQVTASSGPDFAVASDCTSQLAEAQKIFNGPNNADVAVVCHENNGSSYQMVAVGLYADATDQDTDADLQNYGSLAQCMTDRTRVESNLHSEGATIYGELCSPSIENMTGYTMHVYEPMMVDSPTL